MKQILQFVRGGQGEFGNFRIEHIAKEVLRLLRESFPREIELNLRVAESLWPVLGDSTRIHQVITNLCVNARDAMGSRGRLTVRLDNFAADDVYAELDGKLAPGRYVRLTVEDTGCGMTPEVKARIFEPFFTTKGDQGGTGLGLANVRTIVKEHDGAIEVTSAPGKGTQIQIFLRAGADPEIHTSNNGGLCVRGHGEHVLLVDDENGVREMVAATLRGYNYEVTPAVDGIDGLAALATKEARFDVIVSDVAMPNLDGLAFAKAAARMQPGAAIVLASGSLPHGHSRESVQGEGWSFIQKPFTTQQLLCTLDEALRMRRAARRDTDGSAERAAALPNFNANEPAHVSRD